MVVVQRKTMLPHPLQQRPSSGPCRSFDLGKGFKFPIQSVTAPRLALETWAAYLAMMPRV